MKKKSQPGCRCCAPPYHCSWQRFFMGCSGFNPLEDGVTWEIFLDGVSVGSGTGGLARVDSTALVSGTVTITYSKTGFATTTRTMGVGRGACTSSHNNSISGTEIMPVDPAYICCPTRLPGTGPNWQGCTDPLPRSLPCTTSAGPLTLTYDDAFAFWWGTIPINALECHYDSYGNCTGIGMTGTTPLVIWFSCDWTYGSLGASLDMTYASSDPAYTGPICHPFTSCTPAVATGTVCSNVATFGALSQWVAPYACLPRTFLLDSMMHHRFNSNITYDCPNPAAGSVTVG